MTYLSPIPAELAQVEYVKIYFHLQARDRFDLPQQAWLQLRRELLKTVKTLEQWGENNDSMELKNLFHPRVSSDPQVRKLAQKPAPAFVLQPDLQTYGLIEAQQRLVLPVLFVGQGTQKVNLFVDLLAMLGQQGLYQGVGQFMLEAVEAEDASGVRAMLWSEGQREPVSPPVNDLNWLLEREGQDVERVTLEICSPLRLLRKKKPLFKAGFSDLFPFVMRRTSSMLASHACVEVINNPQRYQLLASQLVVEENTLRWQDWRSLDGAEQSQDIGGLLGNLTLAGAGLGELFWLLKLGSLLNVGKGAAYGAGQYRLRTSC